MKHIIYRKILTIITSIKICSKKFIRIDKFIKKYTLKGLLVTKINVENRVDIYNIAKEK